MGAPVDAVELVRATSPAELAALRRLYALYLHDLSEFTSRYQLDEEACWQPTIYAAATDAPSGARVPVRLRPRMRRPLRTTSR